MVCPEARPGIPTPARAEFWRTCWQELAIDKRAEAPDEVVLDGAAPPADGPRAPFGARAADTGSSPASNGLVVGRRAGISPEGPPAVNGVNGRCPKSPGSNAGVNTAPPSPAQQSGSPLQRHSRGDSRGATKEGTWQAPQREPPCLEASPQTLSGLISKLQRGRQRNNSDPEAAARLVSGSPGSVPRLGSSASGGPQGGANGTSQRAVAGNAATPEDRQGNGIEESVLRMPGGPAHAHRGSPPPPVGVCQRSPPHPASSSKSGVCMTPQSSSTPRTPPTEPWHRTGSRDGRGLVGTRRDPRIPRRGDRSGTNSNANSASPRHGTTQHAIYDALNSRHCASSSSSMGPERRRSQRSHSGNSVRAGRKQGTPREYGLVEVISAQRAGELTKGNLPPPLDSPRHVQKSEWQSPALLLSAAEGGCYENITTMPRSTSTISLSSDEIDIKDRLREALSLEQSSSASDQAITANGEASSSASGGNDHHLGRDGRSHGAHSSARMATSQATGNAQWAVPAGFTATVGGVAGQRTPPSGVRAPGGPRSGEPCRGASAVASSYGANGNLPHTAQRQPLSAANAIAAAVPTAAQTQQLLPSAAQVLGRGTSYNSRTLGSYSSTASSASATNGSIKAQSSLNGTAGACRTALTSPSSSCGPPQTPRRSQAPDWTRQHTQTPYTALLSRVSLGHAAQRHSGR
jgi:hypothetical protein